MRWILFSLGVAVVVARGIVWLAGRPGPVRCALRRRHNPVRHPLGGFRCQDCGLAGADLEDMGFQGGGWIAPVHLVGDGRSVTRTADWSVPERALERRRPAATTPSTHETNDWLSELDGPSRYAGAGRYAPASRLTH